MTKKQVIGPRIQRRKNVNILEDMADIAEAVHGSGLPDEFFSEMCCVHDQLTALSRFMNLTPVQVTILAIVAELSEPSVTLTGMANYISCPKTRLNALDSDFYFLDWIGYLCKNRNSSGAESYQIYTTLIESWSNNKLYPPFNQREEESQAFMRRIAFKVIQFHKRLAGGTSAIKSYINTQIEYYQSSGIMACLKCEAHGCPSPSLGAQVLMIVVAYCTMVDYVGFSRDEFICLLDLPSTSERELDSVLDYFIRLSILKYIDDKYYLPTRSFLKSMASVLMVELPGDDIDDETDLTGGISDAPLLISKPEC